MLITIAKRPNIKHQSISIPKLQNFNIPNTDAVSKDQPFTAYAVVTGLAATLCAVAAAAVFSAALPSF